MNKYITEFIGTFFLVLVIGLAGNIPAGFAPVAIGSVLIAMIYAGAHLSGAHYNPAVTLAILMRGKITARDTIIYIVSQLSAASVAALITANVFGAGGDGASVIAEGNIMRGFAAEVLGTFALVYVILNVATTKANSGNNYYGLAIGFTVTAMAYAFGGFSGGAFNPAVAIGQMIGGHMAWSDIWIYLLGSFGGAALASIVFNISNTSEKTRYAMEQSEP